MFFGTLEVAWLAEKDLCSWSQGLSNKLWNKGKKREAFVLAVQQVLQIACCESTPASQVRAVVPQSAASHCYIANLLYQGLFAATVQCQHPLLCSEKQLLS